MASFVPNHCKKKERLQNKEDCLRRLIARGAGNNELLEAAIEVRDARVRVVQVKQANGPQSLIDRSVRKRIEDQIAALQALSAEAVLDEFLKVKSNATTS